MNRLSRRFLALATVLALVALPATGAAAQTPEDVGTARTSLDLLSLDINGVPVVSNLLDDLNLGSLLSYASTDTNAERNALGSGQPFALAQLLAVGQDFTARSDGQQTAGGESASLPNGLGSLTVGQLSAIVEGGEARSVIDALSASLTGVTSLTGLGVGLPDSGSLSTANGSRAAARNGADLSGLEINLGDLLPADLLNNLDLGSLLGLLGDLGLTDLQLSALVGDLTGSLTQIDSLTGTLEGLLAGVGLADVGSLTAAIDGLVAQVGLLEGIIAADDLNAALGLLDQTCAGLLGTLLTACEDQAFNDLDVLKSVALADLDVLEGVLDDVLGVVGDLEGVIGGLLGTLNGLLQTLTGLLDGLTGTDLLALDTLNLGVASAAGQDAEASALCEAGGVRVL
ncbi:MAG TPA: hypothetical protein VM287_06365, partial [Egibacteraceae bacterium]|nr:hypothetical protein [Egibacteraceae bacterium]